MNKIKTHLILVAFFCFIFQMSCTSIDISNPSDDAHNTKYSASESFSYEFVVENQDNASINAINSTINFVGYENILTAKIWGERIVKSESKSDAESHLEKLKVSVNSTNDNIYIETKQPGESNGREYLVNYYMSVPNDWDVSIDIINGIVNIDSVNGDIVIDMVNGEIQLEEIKGNLDVNLTNGEVNCKMILPQNGTCEITSINAKINFYIPQNTSANFAAGVLNGTVSVTNLNLQNLQSANNFVNGLLGDGKGTIKLEAVNGVINASGY